MAWDFILTDLTGAQLGEVTNADSRTVALPHLRVPTASFTIPLDHYLATNLLTTDCLLKCYRREPRDNSRVLAFHGPVTSIQENATNDGQTIAVTAAGPMWRLAKRVIPGSLTTGGAAYGTPASQQDLGTIARSILSDVNGTSFTGISLGSFAASKNGSYGPIWLKNAAEALAELSAGLGSFEFRMTPTEATTVGGVGGWPQIATMDIQPIFQTARPDAIFEYGSSRANVDSYERNIAYDGILTRGHMAISGFPDAPLAGYTPLITRTATAEMGTRGLFEEVVGDNGIADDGLRTGVLDFHLGIRKNPKQVITFNPAVNATPSLFTDYQVGDTVRARATVRGTIRFDAMFRIWGVTVSIDKNGNESASLELVMP